MNEDLYTLKVACATLQSLKQQENVYKRSLLISACDGLIKKAAYDDVLEKRAWLWPALALAGGVALGAYANSSGNEWGNWWGRTKNWMNQDWGQREVIDYANKNFRDNPQARWMYLASHLGRATNSSQAMNRANALASAERETAYRDYRNLDASTRANKVIDSGFRNSGRLAGNIRAGWGAPPTSAPAWGGSTPRYTT